MGLRRSRRRIRCGPKHAPVRLPINKNSKRLKGKGLNFGRRNSQLILLDHGARALLYFLFASLTPPRYGFREGPPSHKSLPEFSFGGFVWGCHVGAVNGGVEIDGDFDGACFRCALNGRQIVGGIRFAAEGGLELASGQRDGEGAAFTHANRIVEAADHSERRAAFPFRVELEGFDHVADVENDRLAQAFQITERQLAAQ